MGAAVNFRRKETEKKLFKIRAKRKLKQFEPSAGRERMKTVFQHNRTRGKMNNVRNHTNDAYAKKEHEFVYSTNIIIKMKTTLSQKKTYRINTCHIEYQCAPK